MAVQLILYPQVYDGYYSYTRPSTGTGANTNTGTGPANPDDPILTPILEDEILGNSTFTTLEVGTVDIGSPTGTTPKSNGVALRSHPAPIGQWRLSYTNDIPAADIPKIENSKLRLTGSAVIGSTSRAYTTVSNLQKGNSYRVLITIDSAPAGRLWIGTQDKVWDQDEVYNSSKRMSQIGGRNGTAEAEDDFIKASNGANYGPALRTGISTQTRFYQNFTARGPVEVLQINYQSTGSTSPLVIDRVSVVASPTGYPRNPSNTGTNLNPNTNQATQSNASVQTFLDDGQVIVDLYKDETIPLNLSVDNFTKVDEKIASYSKSFMVPATKHNNKIFSFYFDVTRSQNQDVFFFNPFAKTMAKIKDDTILIFEGWMRLINVQEKNGQISYNINLYSEPTTFCDYLKASTLGDLDLTELGHDYNITTIPESWDRSIGISLTNPLSTDSFAYDPALGVNNTNVLKYPFINWAGQFEMYDPDSIRVTPPEAIFRPVLNCKYLLQKMFEATPFSFESSFFDTAYFERLFMDFNYSGDLAPMAVTFTMHNSESIGGVDATVANGWQDLALPIMLNENPEGSAYQWYDPTTGKMTVLSPCQVMIAGSPKWRRTYYNGTGEWRYVKQDTGGVDTVMASGNIKFNTSYFSGPQDCNDVDGTNVPVATSGDLEQCGAGRSAGSTWQNYTLNTGESLRIQYRMTSGTGAIYPSSNEDINDWVPDFNEDHYNIVENNSVVFMISGGIQNINFIMQGLRAQMSQYDFWNGLKQMFNLVTMPHPTEPNRLIIEPYKDIFLNNPDSKQIDWTEKLDISNIKHEPLNKLPQATVFTYKEDEDDYRVQQYKNACGGYLYGSKRYEAGSQFFSILTGEAKIEASPFAPTLVAPLTMLFPGFICSHVYKSEDGEFGPFENSPRILYDNDVQNMPTGIDYIVGFFFGLANVPYDTYGQMTHLTEVNPTGSSTKDLNFGECALVNPVGTAPTDNLFNTYWLPYYEQLYNPDCRSLKVKMKLDPGDINEFNFYDTILVKNRVYRVNKIQYNSGLLATVELILIP